MCLCSIFGCRNKTNNKKLLLADKDLVFTIPYFGDLQLNATRDVETEININNIVVSVNLNFYEDTIDKNQIKNVKTVLDDINKYIKIAKEKIKNDFDDKGVVKDYLDHHNEAIVEINDIYQDKNEFFRKLNLTRIGFYPEDESHYAIFDFSIGRKITDYIIVVIFDSNLNVYDINFEN
jgi:hypothetical protein